MGLHVFSSPGCEEMLVVCHLHYVYVDGWTHTTQTYGLLVGLIQIQYLKSFSITVRDPANVWALSPKPEAQDRGL
jgi:hypothetical protein